jgi:hypothetical protein
MTQLPDLYFLHIPKTAGTAVAEFIRAAYSDSDLLNVYTCYDILRLDLAAIRSRRCYTGHFGTGLYGLLDREIASFTILRDPFEQTVSHMRHIDRFLRAHALRHPAWYIQALMGKTIYGYVDHPKLRGMIINYQTRNLGLDLDLKSWHVGMRSPSTRRKVRFDAADRSGLGRLLAEAEQGVAMQDILESAKRRLDSMAVVGTVERIDETLGLICDLLGVTPPARLPEKNVSPGKIVGQRYREHGGLSKSVIDAIDACNEYDRQLYAYANALLDKQLAERAAPSGQ